MHARLGHMAEADSTDLVLTKPIRGSTSPAGTASSRTRAQSIAKSTPPSLAGFIIQYSPSMPSTVADAVNIA